MPAAGAKRALDSLWASAPFKLPSATLALASGGPVAPARHIESMLYESVVQIEASGRSTENEHLVYRVLNSNPDQTLTFSWSPWRAERPVIRARVVSPEGVESVLDASTIVETNATLDGLQLTDVRQLQVALPNVRRGSVIEYSVLTTYTRPMLDGGGLSASWSLWSRDPTRRTNP